MDLKQSKLTKTEWESIERPCSENEKAIFDLIIKGSYDTHIKYNKNKSLISYLKIQKSLGVEYYLFNTYFKDALNNLHILKDIDYKIVQNQTNTLKKMDVMRLENNKLENINKTNIYEYVLLNIWQKLVKYKDNDDDDWVVEYFKLYKLTQNSVIDINHYFLEVLHKFLDKYKKEAEIEYIVSSADEIYEDDSVLLDYEDMTLYQHQKEIFHHMNNPHFESNMELFDNNESNEAQHTQLSPKLVLYIAPTGTGKTLTPLGLSEKYRVIFICAARHVGLALAKCGISANKKVAFAFGCDSEEDIRLHYFAASEYSIHRRSGGIGKVDNSVGNKVEIMICDVKSYLCAMYYMKKFNPVENLLVYWDEPTITMDYEEHAIHEDIHNNWKQNEVPNIVLSSATLPKIYELQDTIDSFKERFPNAEVHNITSYDCKKSIPIIDKNGYVVLPHHISKEYGDIKEIVNHCNENLTLLRYFDLKEIVEFIMFVEEHNYIPNQYLVDKCFETFDDITVQNIKIHYLRILGKIPNGLWGAIYVSLNNNRQKRIGAQSKSSTSNKATATSSGSAMYITTSDAHTLTDGPSIFLSEDVEKVAKFCIQQANIPDKAINDIMEKIAYNNKINERIDVIEKKLEVIEEQNNTKNAENNSVDTKGKRGGKKNTNSKSGSNNDSKNPGIKKMNEELQTLRSMIKTANLNETFVPNSKLHLDKWAPDNKDGKSFTSNIDEETIIDIMSLHGIDDSWKVLLLMGIGVFMNHSNIAYTEIMKKLADEQKLYLIIASSDYIYGTNYQFCHGYLSKTMELTQEKIIQSLGRIGRSNIQQKYSIRIRDDNQIKKIFYKEEDKMEVKMMNRLFSRDR
jgi:hypothetical protein|tara:strand:- start:3515 stop:6073 length:2559 start_codon:yes stop_codon:yes gene_type:complete